MTLESMPTNTNCSPAHYLALMKSSEDWPFPVADRIQEQGYHVLTTDYVGFSRL